MRLGATRARYILLGLLFAVILIAAASHWSAESSTVATSVVLENGVGFKLPWGWRIARVDDGEVSSVTVLDATGQVIELRQPAAGYELRDERLATPVLSSDGRTLRKVFLRGTDSGSSFDTVYYSFGLDFQYGKGCEYWTLSFDVRGPVEDEPQLDSFVKTIHVILEVTKVKAGLKFPRCT